MIIFCFSSLFLLFLFLTSVDQIKAASNPWRHPPHKEKLQSFVCLLDSNKNILRNVVNDQSSLLCSNKYSTTGSNQVMLPVVYVHKVGVKQLLSNYFEISVKQACLFNSLVYIILLGDNNATATVNFTSCAKTIYFNTADAAALFGTEYIHLSTNHFEFEKISIQRWFVLEQFMMANNYDVVFAIDSDVLLYVNVTRDYYCHYQNCSFAVSNYGGKDSASGHSSFWSLEGLRHLNKHVKSMYGEEDNRKKMEAFFQEYKSRFRHIRSASIGGVCDMSHIGTLWLMNQGPKRSLNACNTIDDYASHVGLYDHKRAFNYLNFSQNEMGLPFYNVSGNQYFLKSLHFQGSSKTLLDKFCKHNIN